MQPSASLLQMLACQHYFKRSFISRFNLLAYLIFYKLYYQRYGINISFKKSQQVNATNIEYSNHVHKLWMESIQGTDYQRSELTTYNCFFSEVKSCLYFI